MKIHIKTIIIFSMIVLLFMAQTSSFADKEPRAGVHNLPIPATTTAPAAPTMPKQVHHTIAPTGFVHHQFAAHAVSPNSAGASRTNANEQGQRENHEHQHNKFIPALLYPDNFIPAYIIDPDEDSDSTNIDYNYGDNDTAGSATDDQLPPDEAWVAASDGDVPDNAIPYRTFNNAPTFYCSVQDNGHSYDGELIPNDGCYITNESDTFHVNQYRVLVRKNV